MMGLRKISICQAKKMAAKMGLRPGKIRGLDGVQFTTGRNKRVTPISWCEFQELIRSRGLAVYDNNGWMKIMRNQSF